jgi:hypothetical protein
VIRRRHLAFVCVALLTAAPAQASVDVTSKPKLYPRFERGASDYVSRCDADRPLRLEVSVSGDDRVAVGHRPARGGDFSARVSRPVGAAVAIRVKRRTRSATYHVRCLPRDFPRWSTTRRGSPQAQWYVVTPIGGRTHGYVAIFDANGVPVWWWHSSSYGPWDAKLLPDGRLAWTRYLGDRFGIRHAEVYEERGFDGTLRRSIRVVGAPTDTHELQQLPNGNYLVDAYKPRDGVDLRPYGGPADARVYDALIQELTPSGKVVWSWNSKDHIGLAETGRWWEFLNRQGSPESFDRRSWDLVHVNSIEPAGDGLILSARHLDAVFRIDRATGAVDWKLGGTKRPESLRVIGDPHAHLPLAGQHDARLYRDGTLTVFDNRTGFDAPPRAVRYRIDTAHRTARLLESIDVPDDMRSECCGSARKLRGGNWVSYWGAKPGPVTEQKPSGKTVLELDFGRRWGYRGVPVERGVLSARALRRGMERMTHSTSPSASR